MRTKKPLILLLILLNLLSPFIFIFNSVQAKTQEQESLEPIIQEFDEITFTNGIKLADKEADYLSIVEAKIGDTVEVYSKVEFKQQVFDFDYEIFLPNGAELKADIDCNSIGSFQLDECSYDSKANVIKFKVGNVDIGNIIELKYQVEVTDIQSFISADKAKFLARANYKNSENKTINYSSDCFIYIYWDTDLKISKEIVEGFLAAGEIATVNVVITNESDNRSNKLTITDTIPSNTVLINNSIDNDITHVETNKLISEIAKLNAGDIFEYSYKIQTKEGTLYNAPINSEVTIAEKGKNYSNSDDAEQYLFNWKAIEALLITKIDTPNELGKNSKAKITAQVEAVGEAPVYDIQNNFEILNQKFSVTSVQARVNDLPVAFEDNKLAKLNPGEKLIIDATVNTNGEVKDSEIATIKFNANGFNALSQSIRKDGSFENTNDIDPNDADSKDLKVIVPSFLKLEINNGEESTNNPSVQIKLLTTQSEYAKYFRTISCSNDCEKDIQTGNWSEWETYTEEAILRQLVDNSLEGSKYICAQIKDQWDNISDVKCDSIDYLKSDVQGESEDEGNLSLDEGVILNPGGTDIFIIPNDQINSFQHIPYGLEVIVLGQTEINGELWYQIQLSNGTTGWIKANDIDLDDNYEPQTIYFDFDLYDTSFICNTNKIELMFYPSWDSALVSTLYIGTSFYVIETNGGWSRVVLENGTTGWIYNTFVCEEPQDTSNYLENNIYFKRPYIDLDTGITSEFGLYDGTFHSGTDYALECGSDVLAAAEGEVIEIATDGEVLGNESTPLTKANYIKLRHISPIGEQWETWYWHLSEVFVEVGDKVKQNDLIGKSGNTGYVRGNPEDPVEEQGCHLHFEIRKIDPITGEPVAVDSELMLELSNGTNAEVLNGEEAAKYGVGNTYPNYKIDGVPFLKQGNYDGCMPALGCALTDVAMVFRYYGKDVSPIDFRSSPDNCLANWQEYADRYDDISFEALTEYNGSSTLSAGAVNDILNYLSKGIPVLVGFSYFSEYKNAPSTHWVVVTEYTNGVFYFNDPATGKVGQFSDYNSSTSDDYPQPKNFYIKVFTGPVNFIILNNPKLNQEIFLDVQKINFNWNAFQNTTNYFLEVDNYIKYFTPALSKEISINELNSSLGKNIEWTLTSNLLKDDGSPYSSKSEFSLKPRPPKITRPVSNTVYPNQQINFSIDPVLNHYGNTVDIQYKFQISNDPTFTRVVHDSGWLSNNFYSNYSTPTGGQHYVRAFSRYKLIESSPSQTVSFMVMHPEINYFTYTSVDNEERLYQTVKSTDQSMKLRYSVDGEFDNSSTSEIWNVQDSPTALRSNISTIYFDGKLQQVATGGTTDFPSIFTRTSTNGLDWSTWNMEEVPPSDLFSDRIAGDVEMFIEYYNNQPRLYQMITTEGQSIFIRYLIGSSWSEWKLENGMTNQDVHTYRFNNATYQVIKGKYNFSTNTDSYKNYIRKAGGITDDGYILWSPEWQESYGEITSEVNSFEFKGKICHIARSNKLAGNIIMRCSTDGTFDSNNPSEAWFVQNDTNQQTGAALTIESLSDIGSIVFKNRIHNVMRGDAVSGNIWTRSSRDGDFSDQKDIADMTQEDLEQMEAESWTQTPGATVSNISMAKFKDKLYQSVTSENNTGIIFIRNTADGKFDTSEPNEQWTQVAGEIDGDPTLFSYVTPSGEERLYQAVRGKGNTIVYIRYTIDGKFDSSTSTEIWQSGQGNTLSNIKGIQFNGKLYQTVTSQSGSGEIYMRSSASGNFNETNSGWVKQSGKTSGDIELAVSTGLDSSGNIQTRMYQAIRSYTMINTTDNTYSIWMRSTADGSFDGTNATKSVPDSFENWSQINGETKSDINLLGILINGEQRLYQTVRGGSGKLASRYSTDGVFDNNPANEQWLSDANSVPDETSMNEFQGKLYQAFRGGSKSIWMRNSSDGIFDNALNGYAPPADPREAWHEIIPLEKWRLEAGSTKTDINSIEFNGKLYQTIKGDSSETIYMRSSSDGEFNNTLEAWISQSGGSTTSITMAVFNGKLIQTMKGTSTIYMRSTSDGVFDTVDEEWKVSSSTQVPSKSIEMKVFNNSLIQATSLSDGKIALRVSQDGIFDTSSEQWKVYTNQTKGNVYMEVFDNKLYLMVRGYSDDKDVYYTTITSSTLPSSLTWKQLGPEGTSTTSDVTMTVFQNSLFIGLRGNSNTGNYKATDSTNIDIEGWKNDYPQAKEFESNINWAVFNGKIYQFIVDKNNNIWSRSSHTKELNFVN